MICLNAVIENGNNNAFSCIPFLPCWCYVHVETIFGATVLQRKRKRRNDYDYSVCCKRAKSNATTIQTKTLDTNESGVSVLYTYTYVHRWHLFHYILRSIVATRKVIVCNFASANRPWEEGAFGNQFFIFNKTI